MARRGVRSGTAASVRAFWEREACGERYGGIDVNYAQIDRIRYHLEPQIPGFAQFHTPFEGRALEIGLGTGADHCRNVQRGGEWYGIDLTARSLTHVRKRIGAASRLVNGDAEQLPFADGVFDLIYSWGVLLCCPHIERSIAEVHRVLRPGGRALLMLYHARSWVALAAWLRWGWFRGLSPAGAVSYMESPGTQAFTVNQAARLLGGFSVKSVRSVHTSWDTRWLGPLGRVGGDRMGWFLLCEAVK